MAHFMQLIDSKHLGALNFTDENMQPKPRRLTIREVKPGRPPNWPKNKPDKWETFFEETEKSAFFATSQLKKLANELMQADPAKWSGAVLTVTCDQVKSPAGGMTMGMRIVGIERPQKSSHKQEPTNAQ